MAGAGRANNLSEQEEEVLRKDTHLLNAILYFLRDG